MRGNVKWKRPVLLALGILFMLVVIITNIVH